MQVLRAETLYVSRRGGAVSPLRRRCHRVHWLQEGGHLAGHASVPVSRGCSFTSFVDRGLRNRCPTALHTVPGRLYATSGGGGGVDLDGDGAFRKVPGEMHEGDWVRHERMFTASVGLSARSATA